MRHVTRIRTAGTAVAVALLAAACGTFADDDPAPLPAATGTVLPPTAVPTGTPDVSAEDAVAIALDAVGGGDVVETDVDEFDVVINVWEITVVTPDGLRRQVTVDMRSGTIVENELDD